ncbi:hypothetical protein KY495_02810 [Massilia sp. PAMC28688]|uniref:hypothetical protein n=1 Tax=Massilia sp. PAMC28688 TaxID=2861283 RepID=UPI001C631CF5|nr:hypothetical protein [Massilia sp. PAMC28688]QYF94179.1 hypothetical protein KY495_02810 [Massilia sp. PAMC28688]
MKGMKLSVLLAALLAIGLAGCRSTGMTDDNAASTTVSSDSDTPMASGSGTAAGTGTTAGTSTSAGTGTSASSGAGTWSGSTASGATGTAGGAGSMAGTGTGRASASTDPAQASTAPPPGMAQAYAAAATGAPNSTVTSIEVVPRHSSGAATAAGATAGQGAVGGSSTAGTTGASVTGDRSYRITLRMDDGRTQVITQDWAPAFGTGERVRMIDGVIRR